MGSHINNIDDYIKSFGKLILQKSIICNKNDKGEDIDDFIFISPMDMTYSLYVSLVINGNVDNVDDDDGCSRFSYNKEKNSSGSRNKTKMERNLSFVKGIKNADPASFVNSIIYSSQYKDSRLSINKKTGVISRNDATLSITPIVTRKCIKNDKNGMLIDLYETTPLRFVNRY